MATTRKDHLDFCKARALEYVARGDIHGAFTSMVSDLGKHDETKGHMGIMLGTELLVGGHLDSPIKMRQFIEGFA